MGVACNESRERDNNIDIKSSNKIIRKNTMPYGDLNKNDTSNNSNIKKYPFKSMNSAFIKTKVNFPNINDKKEKIDKEIDYDSLFFDHKNDMLNLIDIMKTIEDKKSIDYYYIINKNWKEIIKNNFSETEIKAKYKISKKDVSYPYNFEIISQKICNKYIDISKKEIKPFLITLIKDYIIIEEIMENNYLFFVCPLTENCYIFNVDFIFSFLDEEEKDNCYDRIKTFILNKRFMEKEKNKLTYIYKQNENNNIIGFYICFPSNFINKNNDKTFTYFDLNKIYDNFLLSLKNIKQIKSEEIEDSNIQLQYNNIINPIFIIRQKHFQELLKEIHFEEYQQYKINNTDAKLENNTLNAEIKDNNKIIKLLNDIELSYEECKYENSFYLINEEFCKNIKNNFKIKDNSRYLLLIDNDYYLYFKNDKQKLKIITNNIITNEWNVFEEENNEKNISFNEILENKLEEIKENNKNNFAKKLIYLYCNDIYFKNKIESKGNFSNVEKVILINKKWLDKYKEFYNYKDIIRTIKYNISNIEIINNDFNSVVENIFNSYGYKIPEMQNDSKLPEDLKSPEKLLPDVFNDLNCNFPINFELVKVELFNLLIKERGIDDHYYIESKNNICDCVFLKNNIIINEKNNPNTLLIYSSDKSKINLEDFKIKFIFQYMNSSITQNEINYIKNFKNLDNYINNKYLDISKYGMQNFQNGIFYNFIKPEKLGIESFTEPPLIGLANIGATCYMNSTLQCLSNIKTLVNYFLNNYSLFFKDILKYEMTIEFSKVIKNLWNEKKKKGYYEPYDFKNKIGEKNPLFSGIAANDSKDLILFIFEELHKELNNPNKKFIDNLLEIKSNHISDQANEKEVYEKFKKEYYTQNNSIIQKIFYGEQEAFNLCHNCKTKIYNFSIFNFLIFPLEKVRQYLIKKRPNGFFKVTLEDCFEQYVSEEIMSGVNQMYCNHCHINSDYSMCNKIYKHPEVIVIILNRGKGLEFDVEFDYPINIKINNYINFENNINYENNENIEYELISVITHLGDSSMSGHFIASCKSPVDKKWYLYNDAIVTENNDFLDTMNNNSKKSIPYVLFYQIIDKKPIQDVNPEKIEENLDEKKNNKKFSNNKKITLYFDFPNEKQLFLELDENIIFKEAILLLIHKSNLEQKEYKCFRKNNLKIDETKSIKDNSLNNEEHIRIEY